MSGAYALGVIGYTASFYAKKRYKALLVMQAELLQFWLIRWK